MNSNLKITAFGPGEAAIILKGKANLKGQTFNVAFPQFPSIPVQKVIRYEIKDDDLLLIIDADQLSDILEAGSPCQIKIPELNLIQTIIWPAIIGKRSHDRIIINMNLTKVNGLTEKTEKFEDKTEVISKKEPVFKSFKQSNLELLKKQHENKAMNGSFPQARMSENQSTYSSNEQTEYIQSSIINEPTQTDVPVVKKSTPWIVFGILFGFLIVISIAYGFHLKASHNLNSKKLPAPEKVIKKQNKSDQDKDKSNKNEENKKIDREKASLTSESLNNKIQNNFLDLKSLPFQEVIDKASNTSSITREGERRLENKQADDGILLLENAASKGDNEAMVKLGQLYSPVDFKTNGPIPSPDMRESARYFQKAAQNGSQEVTVPRQALHDWLSKKADEGNEMARLTLKDFWQ